MGAKYQEMFTINANLQALCDVIRSREFSSDLRVAIKSENPTQTCIWYRIHHGVTFTSWGEKITVTLTPVDDNMTQVSILSECGMPTQVIDWGKNRQVVNNIYKYLESHVDRNAKPKRKSRTSSSSHSKAPRSFCHKCGKPIRASAKFCSSCGTKLM